MLIPEETSTLGQAFFQAGPGRRAVGPRGAAAGSPGPDGATASCFAPGTDPRELPGMVDLRARKKRATRS